MQLKVSWMFSLSMPIRGKGRLVASDHGLRWEVTGLIRRRTDGSSWADMHTFGRQGNTLNIAWLNETEMGPLMSAFTFEADLQQAQQVENIARQHLDSTNWRVGYESPDTGRWDAMWAKRWK
jgi:hypothetical protein